MKISLNSKEKRNLKYVLIILLIVAMFGSSFLTWRKAVKAERNSQAVMNYINLQIQRGVFPAPPQPQPAAPPVEGKKEEKKDG